MFKERRIHDKVFLALTRNHCTFTWFSVEQSGIVLGKGSNNAFRASYSILWRFGKISKADQKVKAGMVYSCKTLDCVPVLLKQGHPTTVFCKYLFGKANIAWNFLLLEEG